MAASMSIRNVACVNEAKAGVPILSGIGYLDHMIDQWNSHAQVGVGLEVVTEAESEKENVEHDHANRNRLEAGNQVQLCTAVGKELGGALKKVLVSTQDASPATSRFCCPLDEALVECIISSTNGETIDDDLTNYSLAPYGIYPRNVGRTKIGKLETSAIESFWKALASSAGISISLEKIRGDNAHHIVESSFKAFSRALRVFLDPPGIWDKGSPNDVAGVALRREGKIERTTKETSISVHVLLNGSSEETVVDTGTPFLDKFYTVMAKEADMTLKIRCKGDLWVDDHHTAEDVSIAIGQCLTQALGSKAGLNRMWLSDATKEEATVEVTMDLSNRPYFEHNLHETLGRQEYVDFDGNDGDAAVDNSSLLSCEMFEHCLDSLVMNSRMTVHVVEKEVKEATSVADVCLATAMAFGRALRVCAMVDRRRAGATASSKGTLSV
mmetsp:Transcript_19395/g.44990  ORF Transcript_19395/g.44990 Transcript_19395/m.44990 type:complete len:441 (-) Transcript_19395:379-1701(-)